MLVRRGPLAWWERESRPAMPTIRSLTRGSDIRSDGYGLTGCFWMRSAMRTRDATWDRNTAAGANRSDTRVADCLVTRSNFG